MAALSVREGLAGLLTNKIDYSQLRVGDHIYSWRNMIYAHHGVYIGDDMVIHFNREPKDDLDASTASTLSLFTSSMASSAGPSHSARGTWADNFFTGSFLRPENSLPGGPLVCLCTGMEVHGATPEKIGVAKSCLGCFLNGGQLYRFEYGVMQVTKALKLSGTCTTAASDPADEVLRRAHFLLERGFGDYDLFHNNCEDFSLYCKTGLVIRAHERFGTRGRSCQVQGHAGAVIAAASIFPARLLTANPYVSAAMALGMVTLSRVSTDLGQRDDVEKVPVEELVKRWEVEARSA
ncbi:NC domain-containing protein [Klebsormidium nitens]|uniref:NC domain-containing protein n=1 Tax=Klebsormidium nitens TaxID=105231 RepID=A0A1Y1IR40_KLENI|nr:NC domain-containing protein [Klebsormidium nitens]|eukprot:GAQ91939.1 NC domain-containing protein [Klebsormidium nitens]